MSMARGIFIGWLNSDDLYTPGAVSRAISVFEANPNWVMHYGQGEHINEQGDFIEAYPTLPPDTPYEKFTEGCFICQPTVFFKRSAITLIGKLDESLKMAFDFDYWLRAFKKLGERIGFVNQVQAKSRLHAECLTIKENKLGLKEGSDSLIKHLGFAPSSWKTNVIKNILNSSKKEGEKNYLKKIGESGIKHAKEKPFSDPECGLYLASIGTILYLLPSKPSKILDLGCGTGWTSILYAKSGYEVIGQDISQDMINVANQNKIESGLNNIEFITEDFENFAFNEEFDAAIFFDCLHHCDDEMLAIRSAYNALKPGGILITHEPGVGHSKTPASVKAMEEFGVNERDMPPFQIINCGLKVGFSEYRIFPMQDELLRIFYNWNQADSRSSGGKELVKNISNIIFSPNDKSSSIVVLKKQ
jgi:SAM-dependent methyltransferase